ncbi:hypothetical protein [Pseudoalteromonas rubra]|uniref:hypothetical protein n=1 Tax=Pseudoalteromonas rubra TaxID=43658 RepID=UPI000F7989C5|nr:hypothetical protein [Pseudoalteromonas rubra]
MTIETELARLQLASSEQTAASQSLQAEVSGKMGVIDQSILNMESKVNAEIASLKKNIAAASRTTLFVDQQSPDSSDDNLGTSGSPLKSIREAVARTPAGGHVFVNLLSDYEYSEQFEKNEIFQNVYIYIRTMTGHATAKKLIFKPYVSNINGVNYASCGGIEVRGNCAINTYGIEIVLPDFSGGVFSGLPDSSANPIRVTGSTYATSLTFKHSYCTFTRPSVSRALIKHRYCFLDLIALASIESEQLMTGYWVSGYEAGSPPGNEVRVIPSNLTL